VESRLVQYEAGEDSALFRSTRHSRDEIHETHSEIHLLYDRRSEDILEELEK